MKTIVDIKIKAGNDPYLLLFPGLGLNPESYLPAIPVKQALITVCYTEYNVHEMVHAANLKTIAEQIAKMINRELAGKPVIVISHSMGSIVAGLCLQLLNVNGWLNFEGNLEDQDYFFSRRIVRFKRDEFIDWGYQNFFSILEKSFRINNNPAMKQYISILKNVNRTALWQHAKDTVDLTLQHIPLNSFVEFQEKKVYIVGSKSKISPTLTRLKETEKLAIEEIKESGHFMFMDNPEGCKNWIAYFIKSLY